jgi:hypothetical protein
MAPKKAWIFGYRDADGLVKVPLTEVLILIGAARNLWANPPDLEALSPEQRAAWQRFSEVCEASPFIAPLEPVALGLLETT